MPVAVRISFGSLQPKPDSIWNRLAARLGREPTNQEAADEVRRILREAREDCLRPIAR